MSSQSPSVSAAADRSLQALQALQAVDAHHRQALQLHADIHAAAPVADPDTFQELETASTRVQREALTIPDALIGEAASTVAAAVRVFPRHRAMLQTDTFGLAGRISSARQDRIRVAEVDDRVPRDVTTAADARRHRNTLHEFGQQPEFSRPVPAARIIAEDGRLGRQGQLLEQEASLRAEAERMVGEQRVDVERATQCARAASDALSLHDSRARELQGAVDAAGRSANQASETLQQNSARLTEAQAAVERATQDLAAARSAAPRQPDVSSLQAQQQTEISAREGAERQARQQLDQLLAEQTRLKAERTAAGTAFNAFKDALVARKREELAAVTAQLATLDTDTQAQRGHLAAQLKDAQATLDGLASRQTAEQQARQQVITDAQHNLQVLRDQQAQALAALQKQLAALPAEPLPSAAAAPADPHAAQRSDLTKQVAALPAQQQAARVEPERAVQTAQQNVTDLNALHSRQQTEAQQRVDQCRAAIVEAARDSRATALAQQRDALTALLANERTINSAVLNELPDAATLHATYTARVEALQALRPRLQAAQRAFDECALAVLNLRVQHAAAVAQHEQQNAQATTAQAQRLQAAEVAQRDAQAALSRAQASGIVPPEGSRNDAQQALRTHTAARTALAQAVTDANVQVEALEKRAHEQGVAHQARGREIEAQMQALQRELAEGDDRRANSARWIQLRREPRPSSDAAPASNAALSASATSAAMASSPSAATAVVADVNSSPSATRAHALDRNDEADADEIGDGSGAGAGASAARRAAGADASDVDADDELDDHARDIQIVLTARALPGYNVSMAPIAGRARSLLLTLHEERRPARADAVADDAAGAASASDSERPGRRLAVNSQFDPSTWQRQYADVMSRLAPTMPRHADRDASLDGTRTPPAPMVASTTLDPDRPSDRATVTAQPAAAVTAGTRTPERSRRPSENLDSTPPQTQDNSRLLRLYQSLMAPTVNPNAGPAARDRMPVPLAATASAATGQSGSRQPSPSMGPTPVSAAVRSSLHTRVDSLSDLDDAALTSRREDGANRANRSLDAIAARLHEMGPSTFATGAQRPVTSPLTSNRVSAASAPATGASASTGSPALRPSVVVSDDRDGRMSSTVRRPLSRESSNRSLGAPSASAGSGTGAALSGLPMPRRDLAASRPLNDVDSYRLTATSRRTLAPSAAAAAVSDSDLEPTSTRPLSDVGYDRMRAPLNRSLAASSAAAAAASDSGRGPSSARRDSSARGVGISRSALAGTATAHPRTENVWINIARDLEPAITAAVARNYPLANSIVHATFVRHSMPIAELNKFVVASAPRDGGGSTPRREAGDGSLLTRNTQFGHNHLGEHIDSVMVYVFGKIEASTTARR